MSASLAIGTRASAATSIPLRDEVLKKFESLFEIEGGRDSLQIQPELHHRVRHLWLDSDDDRLGAAQFRGMSDAANRAAGERIEHIERRHVDDHAANAQS